jgi:hypothetical protein
MLNGAKTLVFVDIHSPISIHIDTVNKNLILTIL